MAHAIPDQNPGRTLNPAKANSQRRILFLGLGAAAALALFLAHRGSAAAPAAAATNPAQDPNAGSTFADNGGQAAQLGNDVTGALSDQTTAIQGLQSSLSGLPDQIASATAAAVATTQQPPSDVTGTAAAQDPAAAVSPVVVNVNTTPSGAGSPAGKQTRSVVRPSAAHGGKLWVYRPAASGRLVPVSAAPRGSRATPRPAPRREPVRTPPRKKGAAAGKHR